MIGRRPLFAWALIILFLAVGWMGFLRLQQTITGWSWLAALGIRPGLFYLAGSGAAWVIAGLMAAVLTFLRVRWTPPAANLAALAAALLYWVDRIFFTVSPSSRVNTPFAAFFTLLLLFLVWGTLWLLEKKDYFKRE